MDEYIEREALKNDIANSTEPFNIGSVFRAINCQPAADVEKMSDGYHTFADLYEQRLILSAALAKNNPNAWKSKQHEDGSVPFGGDGSSWVLTPTKDVTHTTMS